MNNKTLLLTLGLLLSGQVQSAPMLYADYLQALHAPVTHNIQAFVNQNTQPERVINILLNQGQKVDADTLKVFLDNVTILQTSPAYQQYASMLEQMRIQTLFTHGEINDAVQRIELLTSEEQNKFRVLWVVGLLLTEQKEKAIEVFNSTDDDVYRQHKAEYIDVAKNMVIDYGVASQRIQLPEDGNSMLAQRLVVLYTASGIYRKAFAELERVLMLTPDLVEQQRQRQQVVSFAKKHELVHQERLTMDAYLAIAAKKGPRFYGDVNTVNQYTNSLVRYYLDPRNTEQQGQWKDTLLDAQRLAGTFDKNSHHGYLKNRVLLYQDTRPRVFYSDLIELATIEQDRKMISNVYVSKLSHPIRQRLLKHYFVLPARKDDKELVMAEAYADLIARCDEQTPQLVRALKGHKLLLTSPEDAYRCFKSVDWAAVSFSPLMLANLQEEQRQVSYLEMKKEKNEPQIIRIAQRSTNADMKMDAALFAVHHAPLTTSRLAALEAMGGTLALTSDQQQTMEASIIEVLRQQGDTEHLLLFLKHDPSANALELAFLEMEQDATKEAVEYLMVRLNQPAPLSAYERVKSVRYLNSVYASLSPEQQKRLNALPQKSVQTMIALQGIAQKLTHSFGVTTAPTMEAVQEGLTQYNQIKGVLSGKVPESNYTEQLWLLSELNRRFSQFLSTQATQADERFQPILMKQSAQFSAQSQEQRRQLLTLKVEGVTDTTLWEPVRLMGGAMK